MAKHLKHVELNTTIRKLDWKNKEATLSNGLKVEYQHLINTIPLPDLLKLMDPLPLPIKSSSGNLKFASIICLNIGVKRSKISDKSWIYFPEKKYPFYRVGFPMNFTPHVVPKGCSSMYVEIPTNFSRPYSRKQLFQKVRSGLIEAGILTPKDKYPVIQFLPIRYAYVIYDQVRSHALSQIFSFLSKNNIQSIGRYGAWKYSFMEEAILDGKKAAESILLHR
jgi:protoporphyrinogen oxidase